MALTSGQPSVLLLELFLQYLKIGFTGFSPVLASETKKTSVKCRTFY